MKQVIFAIALLAMASLTGCLNTDDTSVDETTDTTYKPSKNSSVLFPGTTFEKTGNSITSSCKSAAGWDYYYISIADANSNVIWTLDGYNLNSGQYGWEQCPTEDSYIRVNITLPQEPVRITLSNWNQDSPLYSSTGTF